MANNFVQPGSTIAYTNASGGNQTAGTPVAIGAQVGVLHDDVADAATGVAHMEGVFSLPKAAGNAWVAGEAVIFDESAGEFLHAGGTPAAGDISNCCVAWAAAGSADVVGLVKLNAGAGTVA